MCEPDSDGVPWFLDVDHIFNSAYNGDSNYYEVNICQEQYIVDRNHDLEHSDVENDEIIAHSLQEELSQLSIAEASESSYSENRHLHVEHNWHPPSATYFYSGRGGGELEANDTGQSSSCSSPGGKSYDGEENSYTLEITDDSELDGEVGKRLNQMISLPHVPRINGDIPSTDEATSDYQRLLDRLQLYDLVERKVQGDGNCQFRALSDQLYDSQEHHKSVRQEVVNQLKSQPDIYKGYVPMAYGDYLKKISKSGEWGDHVTLQAAADSYGVKIIVITSYKDTCYIEILPTVQQSTRVVLLSFWAEVHYNSIYLQEGLDLSPGDSKRKKWWKFGN